MYTNGWVKFKTTLKINNTLVLCHFFNSSKISVTKRFHGKMVKNTGRKQEKSALKTEWYTGLVLPGGEQTESQN